MIKVEYIKEANSLRYASHRKMENNERVIAEQYIMVKVAPKTDFYHKHPSKFVYLGTDERLKKKLANFHQEIKLTSSARKEREMTAAVNNLINDSMRNYYTEKIGELIMSARSELKDGRQYQSKLANLRQQMNDLLNAYNIYSDQKVTLNEIIPTELKPYWPGLEEARCYPSDEDASTGSWKK
jgi:mevalonate kinase